MSETNSPVSEARRRRQRRKRRRMLRRVLTLLLLAAALAAVLFFKQKPGTAEGGPKVLQNVSMPEWVDVQIIPVNGSGRRGLPLEDITAIVVHYVGNPGTSAQQNHDYFAQETTNVSSHFLVGLQGEILQCVPLNEKSSATNDRNRDTISIEVCHPDESGVFNRESYDALVKLTAWLCDLCGFDSHNVIRHYDVTGKVCPKQFVEDENAWTQFLADVDAALTK